MAKKNVVILGAGFGGLRTAMLVGKKLQRLRLLDKYTVTLVDRNDCHLYTPLLYKVAASADNDYELKCTYAIGMLVKNFPVQFLENEIAAIDLPNRMVHLKNNTDLHADYLVVALGSETNYFGIPGLQENALQLKSTGHAMQIRDALSNLFARTGTVRVAIGGGGPNGIELAAEVRAWADRREEDGKLKIDVSIIEAMPTILPGFHPHAIALAWNRLKRLGIGVRTNAKIVSVAPSEILIAGGETIPFDIFIWTGGIKPPDTVIQLPVLKDNHGKPVAKNNMAYAAEAQPETEIPNVYSLGDAVSFTNPKTSKPVPTVARAAILEADIVAHNLVEDIKKMEFSGYKPEVDAYSPSDYPYVIPIGENWAVAKIGPVVFAGWPAWIFEKLIALHYLASIMPLENAFQAWKKMG